MTSTAELFTVMTAGSDDETLQKYLPELSKVALVMVRVLVVSWFIITAVMLTLPTAAASRRVPFWYHDTSGMGNPLALQVSVPFSKRDIIVAMGSSNRMGFTGGVEREGTTQSEIAAHNTTEGHYCVGDLEMERANVLSKSHCVERSMHSYKMFLLQTPLSSVTV